MATAEWNGAVVAESDDTIVVEGNHYFPLEHVNANLLTANAKTSVCPWKGTANYFDIEVGGSVNSAAAWTYLDPKPAAEEIRGRVAFWNGVRVSS